MKKKIWIPIAVCLLLAILFVPVPSGTMGDGGTKVYTALTYKIVQWNKVGTDGTFQETRVYVGAERFQTLDQLWEKEWQSLGHSFYAKVQARENGTALLAVIPGEPEGSSSYEIRIATEGLDFTAREGETVIVTYTGGIMETYPAQVNAIAWRYPQEGDRPEYLDNWLDKETAERQEDNFLGDLVISEIYPDCFVARTVIPLPYYIKVNGSLSGQWCVGDQVHIHHTNTYYDQNNQRMETDMTDIQVGTFVVDPMVAYKPVIYLYPQQKTDVTAKLMLQGKLTCTYPAYGDGWHVTAMPDGTLTDDRGQSYNYLYWEGEIAQQWEMAEGFCIPGAETAAFLEQALAQLGLNRREANEFIVYWLPQLQENAYNVISFQREAYIQAAELEIDPAPDTLIRVFMTWKGSDTFVDLPAQQLTAPRRQGFTVVEWGGTEIQ